ncbi:carbamate kinase [Clostridium sp. AL.422]|uniref:carbamate kinase n=1 Tax=Clostridium TaxID=1485 RepID=UPI00293DF229|nr:MULTISPECIES: carbamate kinase [unclassified Clostridium]MDV4151976.1 carbamate kinase [Clostridium sp. AL.422]
MERIVVALGGNALGNSAKEQLELVKETAKSIADLVESGNEVIVVHGNGPQVGMINLAFEEACDNSNEDIEMPFPECGAMSQGYIGYHLQNSIRIELLKRGIRKNVETIITQVIVDPNDEAFKNPTKPIGKFYNKEQLEKLGKVNYIMKEDAGRGYRRVVPSPKPIDIVEKEVIKNLISNGDIVICAGGGGIPVIKDGDSLIGIAAVIDKDFASEKVAELINADKLVILTAVDGVCINYNTKDEKMLRSISVNEAKKYIEEKQFASGSMLPKVLAALQFVESGRNRKALITSLSRAKEALHGLTGTIIE